MPRRTRSLFHNEKPTTIAYTSDGSWLVCGFANGQIQIWNAFSLTLEKTMCGHNGAVNALTHSPKSAFYEPRLISCGSDQQIRVWHPCGWIPEQIVPDLKSDKTGVRSCSFSASGDWLVSVSHATCLWKVVISKKGHFYLRLHQHLVNVCGAESLCSAAFSCSNDTIAVGSRDGVLGLWSKIPGAPQEVVPESQSSHKPQAWMSNTSRPWVPPVEHKLAKPMQMITPEGVKPLPKTSLSSRQRMSMTMSTVGSFIGGRAMAVREKMTYTAGEDGDQASEEVLEKKRTQSVPDLHRWKSGNFEVEDALTVYCMEASGDGQRPHTGEQPLLRGSCDDITGDISPIRKSILHASTRLVKRISLEPRVIGAMPGVPSSD